MTYTYSTELYSDLHKDVFGCRPGQTTWDHWMSLDAGQKQDEWDYLVERLREQEDEMRELQKQAVADFEKEIVRNQVMGAATRNNAIRWILDAYDTDELAFYGADKVAYDRGLPYNHSLVAEMNFVLNMKETA